MEPRMDISQVAPDGFAAVLGLEKYARTHVEHDLYELIKLRASMDNGCAFCVDMHTTDWLGSGQDVRRIVAVSAWHESPFFSDRERTVLALTDAVTRLGEHGVPDDVWEPAAKAFTEEELGNLLMAIATINVWNRLSIAVRNEPPAL